MVHNRSRLHTAWAIVVKQETIECDSSAQHATKVVSISSDIDHSYITLYSFHLSVFGNLKDLRIVDSRSSMRVDIDSDNF